MNERWCSDCHKTLAPGTRMRCKLCSAIREQARQEAIAEVVNFLAREHRPEWRWPLADTADFVAREFGTAPHSFVRFTITVEEMSDGFKVDVAGAPDREPITFKTRWLHQAIRAAGHHMVSETLVDGGGDREAA